MSGTAPSDLTPFAIGTVLAVQVHTFGSVSGGLFNPAVTLAVLVSGRRKISIHDAAMYVLAQLIGASLGGLAAYQATNTTFCFCKEKNSVNGSLGASFVLEALCATVLCSTVLATGTSEDAPNQYFGFAIGSSVMACAVMCGVFNKGSFNPAVTWGINLANTYNNQATSNPSFGAWCVFILGPFLGAFLASTIFILTRYREFQIRNPNDLTIGSFKHITSIASFAVITMKGDRLTVVLPLHSKVSQLKGHVRTGLNLGHNSGLKLMIKDQMLAPDESMLFPFCSDLAIPIKVTAIHSRTLSIKRHIYAEPVYVDSDLVQLDADFSLESQAKNLDPCDDSLSKDGWVDLYVLTGIDKPPEDTRDLEGFITELDLNLTAQGAFGCGQTLVVIRRC